MPGYGPRRRSGSGSDPVPGLYRWTISDFRNIQKSCRGAAVSERQAKTEALAAATGRATFLVAALCTVFDPAGGGWFLRGDRHRNKWERWESLNVVAAPAPRGPPRRRKN